MIIVHLIGYTQCSINVGSSDGRHRDYHIELNFHALMAMESDSYLSLEAAVVVIGILARDYHWLRLLSQRARADTFAFSPRCLIRRIITRSRLEPIVRGSCGLIAPNRRVCRAVLASQRDLRCFAQRSRSRGIHARVCGPHRE